MKKQVVFCLVFISLCYGFLCWYGYHQIWAANDTVVETHQVIMNEIARGNTFINPQIERYNNAVEEYERRQGLVQTFWYKYIIDFPQYDPLTYEELKPLMDEG